MSGTLCRCICGTGKKDHFELQRTFGSNELDIDALAEADEAPFQPPPFASGRLTYSILQQPLRGAPIREGTLWYLSAEDQVDPVFFSLYVNGFAFKHEGVEAAISLSPFVLVRNCKFQSGYSACLSDVKIFKISLFAHSACYYFGIRSEGEGERWAEEERSRWVLDISRAVRLVTQSLFPPFRITCDPLKGLPHTDARLMAGYMVRLDDAATASVLYVELHVHQEEYAKVVLYENELCQVAVSEILLSETAMCSEKIGINCSCFSVEDHHFSTRTLAERKLWLRAISNVRVKLQNHAPKPEEEEMANYRAAIKEHLLTIRAALEGPGLTNGTGGAVKPGGLACGPQSMDALLQRCHPRRPPPGSSGQHQWPIAVQALSTEPAMGGPSWHLGGTRPAPEAPNRLAEKDQPSANPEEEPKKADDLNGIRLELDVTRRSPARAGSPRHQGESNVRYSGSGLQEIPKPGNG
eukprot:TRINITY_DN75738_c0_g1_i1.p1 TRINITY_DN75738_c0_g1~~TRINITY_DN75738_c0_g1_i1.p1  ORF type:complete len:467 (-),score=76.54 TRINITY_DN75738_c0_g1_i1:90-1490(-)